MRVCWSPPGAKSVPPSTPSPLRWSIQKPRISGKSAGYKMSWGQNVCCPSPERVLPPASKKLTKPPQFGRKPGLGRTRTKADVPVRCSPEPGRSVMSEKSASAVSVNLIPRNKVAETDDGIELKLDFRPNPEFAAARAHRSELLFRHSGWKQIRKKTFESLTRTGTSVAVLDRFAECGSEMMAEVDVENEAATISCNKCRNRMCQACGSDRGALITQNLIAVMKTTKPIFATLTRRHSTAPLSDQISGLYKCFADLRRRNFWKENVQGGAAFLECHVSEKTGLWHVHLHLILDSRFLDSRVLSTEWLAVTNDSSIVDVRAISDLTKVGSYVASYVCKPCKASVYNLPEKLDEFIVSMRGRRLCLTFGTWRGTRLEKVDKRTGNWVRVGNLDTLARRYYEGDKAASICLNILLVKYPRLAECIPPPRWEGPNELAM